MYYIAKLKYFWWAVRDLNLRLSA
ncbi:hypothetical protein DSUL_100174 [Desulfovibrionales bacterium]